jgi:putative ATP-dependent endonuclease of OLD family
MKACSLHLHNYRSIEDADIELTPYSLLVGPNNAGKSNIIAAIRTFYEKGLKYDESRDFPKFQTQDNESWMEIQYTPDEEEWAQLKDEYKIPNGTFKVRKYFKSDELDAEGKKKEGIYAYVTEKLSDTRFYGAKNVQQGKLGDIIYIPAVSKIDEHTKFTGPSALRDLVNVVLKGVLSASKSYQGLTSAFDDFGQQLKKETTIEGHSLEGLEKRISSELDDWGVGFELSVNPVQPEEIVKTLIRHQIVDKTLEKAQDTSAFGDGFQRQLIFTLLRLAAEYEPKKAPSKKKEFSPSLTWILFEEPEAFLHPSQLDILNRSLCAFGQEEGQQVLISSHSVQFASLNIEELPKIVRLNNEEGRSKTGQVRTEELQSLLAANQSCIDELAAAGISTSDIDATVDMESIKYALWLNPLRSTVFFARSVLLVEGASERALIAYLLAEGKLNTPKGGITIVDTMGKWNTHRFMNLLGKMRIIHSVLYDRDGGSIKSVALEKAIESSVNQFTSKIDFFDHDLEEYLGVQKPGRLDQKPQHLMWHFKQDNIYKVKLQNLCIKLQNLIGT